MEENNDNEFKINPEVKTTNEPKGTSKNKSKVVPVLVVVIVILLLLLVLCAGNMYALTKDYDNVFAMVVDMIWGEEEVSGEEDVDSDDKNNLNEGTNIDLDEDETIKNELALGIIDIEGKDCLNFEPNDGVTRKYTIIDNNEEKNGIEIYKLDKLYLSINSDDLNNISGQKINIESGKSYQITNINAEDVKSIYISDYEQDSSWNYAFFLMNDGTVEWLDLEDALSNNDFTAEGKLSGITNVQRIAKVEFIYGYSANSGYASSIVAIKENGEYYDLIDKCMNTNYDEATRENMVIVDRQEALGVNVSKLGEKLYLTLVSNKLARNIEKNKAYEITNINVSDIKSIYVSEHGNGINYPVALFLMNDGTVEWLNVEDAIVDNDFVAEGKIENVTNVVRIAKANVGQHYEISNDGAGWISVIGIKEDGNFYDLVDETVNLSNETVEINVGFYQSNREGLGNEFQGNGVRLFEDYTCRINFGVTGQSFEGTYEVQGSTLICKLTKLKGEYIADTDINIEYYFTVNDSQTLEFKQSEGEIGGVWSTLDQKEYEWENVEVFESGLTFTFEN